MGGALGSTCEKIAGTQGMQRDSQKETSERGERLERTGERMCQVCPGTIVKAGVATNGR